MSFFKPSPPPKVEPPPTRDTAVAALDQQKQDEEVRKRRAAVQGMASTMLTGSSGVMTELSGTRTMTNG